MINLSINSPEKTLFNNSDSNDGIFIQEIIIDTDNGVIGIRDGHENMISSLPNGELSIIFNDNSKMIFAIAPGIIRIENKGNQFENKIKQSENKNNENITDINILLQEAENVESINIQELEKSISRAKEASEEKENIDTFINEQLLRDLNKIKTAKRHTR